MRLRYKLLIASIPLLVVATMGLAFSVQAKNHADYLDNENAYLKTRVANLEKITQPPKVNVLSGTLAFNEDAISISKLIIEDLGLNTMVRAEIANKSNQVKTYQIVSRNATFTQEGYQALDINSPFVAVPLTNILTIDSGEKRSLVILVSKLEQTIHWYANTEAWISIKEVSNAQIQNELVLRILIKP